MNPKDTGTPNHLISNWDFVQAGSFATWIPGVQTLLPCSCATSKVSPAKKKSPNSIYLVFPRKGTWVTIISQMRGGGGHFPCHQKAIKVSIFPIKREHGLPYMEFQRCHSPPPIPFLRRGYPHQKAIENTGKGLEASDVYPGCRLASVGPQREGMARDCRSFGGFMVVVGKHFTFLLIVVWWEIPT